DMCVRLARRLRREACKQHLSGRPATQAPPVPRPSRARPALVPRARVDRPEHRKLVWRPSKSALTLTSTRGTMTADLPGYAPSEEHELLRQSVRDLATERIAPHAAEVDENGEFPQQALDALVASDLHAVHIPEAYGGSGADALATVIVIE